MNLAEINQNKLIALEKAVQVYSWKNYYNNSQLDIPTAEEIVEMATEFENYINNTNNQ